MHVVILSRTIPCLVGLVNNDADPRFAATLSGPESPGSGSGEVHNGHMSGMRQRNKLASLNITMVATEASPCSPPNQLEHT